MKYPQLSEAAKEQARDWYRQCLNEDPDWHDDTLEDQKEQLRGKGFPDATIHYSGFSRQGDGASFECGWMDREFPIPAELATALAEARAMAIVQRRFDGERADSLDFNCELMVCIVRNDHRYFHQYTMGAEASLELGNDIPDDLATKLDAWREETEKAITEESRDLATEIYNTLDREWDYQNSDTTITAHLEEGDYDFYCDGSIMVKRDRVPVPVSAAA